jgi:hypothetical protein
MVTSNLPESVMPTDRYRSSPSTTSYAKSSGGIPQDGFELPRRYLMGRQVFGVLGILIVAQRIYDVNMLRPGRPGWQRGEHPITYANLCATRDFRDSAPVADQSVESISRNGRDVFRYFGLCEHPQFFSTRSGRYWRIPGSSGLLLFSKMYWQMRALTEAGVSGSAIRVINSIDNEPLVLEWCQHDQAQVIRKNVEAQGPHAK